ncbi:MAG: hypothetical protein ACKVHE_30095, partial [Planctomycetales bacterium]
MIVVVQITVEGLREFNVEPFRDSKSVRYEIIDDGGVVRIETDTNSHRLVELRIDPATGKAIESSLAGPYSPFFENLNMGLGISRKNPSPRLEYGQYAEDSILLRSVRLGENPWYYLPQEGILASYNTGDAPVRIWRIGPDGAMGDGESVTRRFKGSVYEAVLSLMQNYSRNTVFPRGDGRVEPVYVSWSNMLAFEDGIYSIDRDNLDVHQIYAASEDDPLVQFAPAPSGTESAVWLLHRKTARKVVLSEVIDGKATQLPRDAAGRLSFHMDLPGYEIRYPDVMPESGVEFFDLPETKQVAYRWRNPPTKFMGNFRQNVVVATRRGEIVKQIVHDGPVNVRSDDAHLLAIYPSGLTEGLMRLFPDAADAPVSAGIRTDYFVAPHTYFYEIAMWLSTLTAALVAVLIGRRASQSRVSILRWSLGIVMFGPAGLVTLLAIRERPRSQECANCCQSRPLSDTSCPHCSKPFPKPEIDGTEILLPMNGASEVAA